MNKTLRISFSLKNTYRVNAILYSLKQVPLLKKLIPDHLYGVRGLKIFANVLSAILEIISIFLGKFLYLLLMFVLPIGFYSNLPGRDLFLHWMVCLTIIGAFANTYLFDPSRDKYYAMILLRMPAREYTLIHYAYALAKLVVGMLPFAWWFGREQGIPTWLCLLLPVFVASSKVISAAISLHLYERTGRTTNENGLGKYMWLFLLVMLGLAYGLPLLGVVLPWMVSAGVMVVSIFLALAAGKKVYTFSHYYAMYRELLAKSMHQMDDLKSISEEQSRKLISKEAGIASNKKGMEYLNELFIKRHQKILWRSSKRLALIALGLVLVVLTGLSLSPEWKVTTNRLLLTYLPYFVFIMYAINRGTGFTQALFMNCDHSLLTYFFYKEPKWILKLFQIRLREIIKINLLPASVIGVGLAVLLYASGGTTNVLNYGILVVSILALSIFFSVHYLTLYYLLQPYNAGTEMKSATYRIVLSATYLICLFFMRLKMDTFVFGLVTILFCLLYCGVACVLIYRFAPKTFRLRS